MPTIYQRIQLYYKTPGSITLSKKKIRRIANSIAKIYDTRDNPPVKYVQSIEDGGTFTVRLYPDSMIKTIDSIILKVVTNLQMTIDWQRKNPPPPSVEKRIRKRIPIKK